MKQTLQRSPIVQLVQFFNITKKINFFWSEIQDFNEICLSNSMGVH